MNDIAISIRNVSKYYKLYNSPKDRLKEALSFSGKQYHKKFYATRNLNLQIQKGEILGIVGKNGSGKSTLLKLITGVLTPDEGSIAVNGKISALLELGSGFNPEFTGMQNIFFYGTILGFCREEIAEKLDDILAFADIGDFIYQPLKTYSSGMKSRLGFAVAVHIDPEILILDEVLAVGDVLFKRKCYAKMEEFFQSGKTILYVSHDANSIKQLCTRAIFLSDGNILLDADAKTVTTHYEKFLFAPKQQQKELKHSLQRTKKAKTAKQSVERKKPSDRSENSEKKGDHPYFIPNFTPKSRTVYDDSKVEIADIRIETIEGETVNALVHGEKYYYCYQLTFKETCEEVAFGMSIQNEKGFQITSTGSLNYDMLIEEAHSGDTYAAKWEFICLLTAGVYYANAGTTYMLDGERQLLNRVIDGLAFKVLPLSHTVHGIVSLQQVPDYRLLEKDS
ncbi:hypothetical protein YH65_02355 [Sulfurovum lithotrophicum]|uniref:ABC transporter domain-containing protein n=1 Tax=Sulfurovum lithotrophicum TaxID=206403 RepID=A0A7U4M013_9BACT|nr:ABC transporter ATP-binding protein [Sulfurovum lithotrophicum]AKF24363.1 hypothetical protein YH65_02355 [Sulfurovum lithotrophicum]